MTDAMQIDPLKLADEIERSSLYQVSNRAYNTGDPRALSAVVVRGLRLLGAPTPEVPGTSAASYLLGEGADATYRALVAASEALSAILPETELWLLQDIAAAVSLLSHARSAARREVAAPNDDGLKDDLDAALDALIRRINGEADLASAAEWVRLNYPDRAKDLRPVEVAGDVGERVARAIDPVVASGDRSFLHAPGSRIGMAFARATAALSALRPGDVVPGGVVAERPRRGGPHPSHSLRSSDASTFDVICTACGHTDVTPGGWGALVDPCPAAIQEPPHD